MKSSVPLKYQWIMLVTINPIRHINSLVQLEIGDKLIGKFGSNKLIMRIDLGLVNN